MQETKVATGSVKILPSITADVRPERGSVIVLQCPHVLDPIKNDGHPERCYWRLPWDHTFHPTPPELQALYRGVWFKQETLQREPYRNKIPRWVGSRKRIWCNPDPESSGGMNWSISSIGIKLIVKEFISKGRYSWFIYPEWWFIY